MKIGVYRYLRLKFHVCVVIDYADTWLSNFKIEYIHENERVRETVLALFMWGPR